MTKTTYPDMKKIVAEITSKIDVVEVANIIRDGVKSRIDKGKNYDGSAMTALKPATVKTKRKQGGIAPTKPLIFKGGTQKGVQSQRINGKEALVISTGNAKGYYGGSQSSANILKFQADKGRDPFGVSDSDMKEVEKYIKRKLVG